MGTYKYKAFISYSHKDDRWGRWLHRRLENYPLPKNIVGNVTKTGEIPKRLKPIFRDREELAAADDLGDKIEQALSHSENLILICSPAAARSHWVNQEVLYFKRHNRGAQIFSVIVEGEPYASNMPGREAEECFPPALRYQLDEEGNLSDTPAEPLAADLRDHADGKRLGVLKLVSGMIGVGLDEVVQRDMKRSRRRVTAVTSGALAILLAMGTLTGFALDARAEAERGRVEAEAARKEAELRRIEAEEQRNEAEQLINFMITKLFFQLRDSVGELPVMTSVTERAMSYFENQGDSISPYGHELLAKLFGVMGYDAQARGKKSQTQEYYNEQYRNTAAVLADDPTNSDKLFAHAESEVRQSLATQSNETQKENKLEKTLAHLDNAESLLYKIPARDRKLGDWAMLKSYVHANRCSALLKTEQNLNAAVEQCHMAIDLKKQVSAEAPCNKEAPYDLVFNHVVLSRVFDKKGDINQAAKSRNTYIRLNNDLVQKDQCNFLWREQEMEVNSYFADHLKSVKEFDKARHYYQKALKTSNFLIKNDPNNNVWQDYHTDLKQKLDIED